MSDAADNPELDAVDKCLMSMVRTLRQVGVRVERHASDEECEQGLEDILAQLVAVKEAVHTADPDQNKLPCPLHSVEAADQGTPLQKSVKTLQATNTALDASIGPKRAAVGHYLEALQRELAACGT
ncbi:hypothetical protein DIPPA_07118 [Diplonema papillatum]|nr:hypothetical protein DIPPA_07118 [Diplonema papillatum]